VFRDKSTKTTTEATNSFIIKMSFFDIFHRFDELICSNYVRTTVSCLSIIVILSLIPSILILSCPKTTSSLNAYCGIKELAYASESILDYSYISLLLDTVVAAVPMTLEYIIGFPTFFKNTDVLVYRFITVSRMKIP
jgi:hypothetical protein